MMLQIVTEGEESFAPGFETSPKTAAFFGLITGERYILRYNQITRVLEVFSVGGK